MKLIDFINDKYIDFSEFSIDELYDIYKNHTLYIHNKSFNSIDEMHKYEMQDGDAVTLYQCIKKYKENNTIHIQDLRDNVKDIYGLSDRVIDNIKSELGDVFKVAELEDSRKSISGLGKKTIENIIKYVNKNN